MIGLGSNRLTVCRRGGMSVTQAGRGGMEWLAGGRGPSWATPYSAQATAYFKQNYGDYWNDIAAFGLDPANAKYIPYIEEYYDLIANLVYVGKYVYLKSDTKSYIATDWKPATEDVRYITNNIPREFGGAYYTYRFAGTYDGSRGPGLFYSSSPAYISVTNADINTGATIELNKPVISDMTFKNGVINGTINGQSVSKTYSGSFRTCQKTLWIFRYNEGSGTGPNNMGSARFTIYDGGEIVRDFAPYVKDGVACYIDLSAIGVEGKQMYYYNANSQGAFSIEYYTPAS